MDLHPDIAAMLDVIDDMIEATDSLDVETAMLQRESVVELRRRANTLLGLIDTQLIDTLESPRVFDGQRYRVAANGKWIADHSKVVAAIKERAVVDRDTGEMRTPGHAAEAAIKLMMDCYVAPSSFPKTGALEKMGLDKPDVGRFDGKGKKVVVEPVEPS